MSTTTLTPNSEDAGEPSATFYGSVVGKKAVMAVTGVILFGFVLVHMLANLQAFLPVGASGIPPLDAYAEHLRALPPLLWGTRVVLLLAVILHILSAWQLTLLNQFEARKKGYVKYTPIASNYASRTMVWSGPIIFFYVIYHLLDFTFGNVNPDFQPGHVYHNVIASFQHPAIAIFYIVANVCLAFHLYHGVWSMCQSVGISHPRYTPLIKQASAVFAIVIAIGFCSVPIAVMTGILK
ncbi:MAG TPA: succinate dehydrogenase cytochrome b subunit [Terriglobia bacterium]|nr:succinate dehydrogenase cytochrome b subunit [Terriglobia bacterium]